MKTTSTSPVLRMVSRGGTSTGLSRTRSTAAPSATPRAFAAGNPELEQIRNIAHVSPQFKALCTPLQEGAADINAKSSAVASRMGGALQSWLNQLNGAKAELDSVITTLSSIEDSKSVVMWIFDFGGNLSSADTPRERAVKANADVKTALRKVTSEISTVQGIADRLGSSVPVSQLNNWCSGPMKTMIEGVCPTFGVSNREMLRGWWDDKYDSYLSSGSIKPWQTVCDLYQHRLDPRTSPVSYGTTMASGTWVDSAHVLMRQPREGDPRYTRFSSADRIAWGISQLEDGCLSDEDCPVESGSSPASAVRQMKRDAIYIKRLLRTSNFNDILAEVDAAISTATTKVRRLERKLAKMRTVLERDDVERPVKAAIRAIIQGPIRAVALAALSIIPGFGWIVGGILGEALVGQAVRESYERLVDEAMTDEGTANTVRRIDLPNAAATAKIRFAWWSSTSNGLNKRSALREARALTAATKSWLSTWEQMRGLCRIPYPTRTAAQWEAIGVPRRCRVAPKSFDRVVDIFEIDVPTTFGPRGGGGGTGDDRGGPSLPGGGAPEALTPYGSYGSLVAPQKAFPWKKLILTGIVGFVLLRNVRE
jgi:hypothetical protein